MSIILLRGFSNSGKDYIGNILCEKYGYKRFAFADALKKIVASQFTTPIENFHSQEVKPTVCKNDTLGRTHRQLLIDEGARLREINKDIFAKFCCQDIKISYARKIVITDWRYENELQVIKDTFPDFKITPVHIMRIGQNKSLIDDISEYQLIGRQFDYMLINEMNDTIYDKIESLIHSIDIL
jgi:hypothetical protein